RVAASSIWLWRGVWALLLVFLLWRALRVRSAPYVHVNWAFQSADEVIDWMAGLWWREVRVLAYSLALGLLTPWAWPAAMLGDAPKQRWIVRAGWWIFGGIALAVLFTLAWKEFPPMGSLL